MSEKMTQNQFLEFVQRRANEIKQTPGPRKGGKITRHQSKEMRTVTSGTRNATRAIYQTAEQAARNTVVREVVNPTREVGPGDVYNNIYSSGKETQSRNGY